jgi:hypothetical protein
VDFGGDWGVWPILRAEPCFAPAAPGTIWGVWRPLGAGLGVAFPSAGCPSPTLLTLQIPNGSPKKDGHIWTGREIAGKGSIGWGTQIGEHVRIPGRIGSDATLPLEDGLSNLIHSYGVGAPISGWMMNENRQGR